ncbi:MAG: hypothetical protein MUE73_16560 [Planctomycetes bacterium]|jgi:hypothetical protein|nr:hypothetical protein [Planctomycetota bacterium]
MPIVLKRPARVRVEAFRRPWGCPLTRNRTNHCFGLCLPQDGLGTCGRVAPHAIIGRTLRAILAYNARRAAS